MCNTPDPRCGKWSPVAAQADPGGHPSCVHGPRGIWLQRPRMAVGCCDATQARIGVQGRFLDASGLTRQPKYNLFRGAALRHLVSVRAVKRFEHSNPSFCFALLVSEGVASPQPQKLVRGVCLDSIFKARMEGGQCSPHSRATTGKTLTSQRCAYRQASNAQVPARSSKR